MHPHHHMQRPKAATNREGTVSTRIYSQLRHGTENLRHWHLLISHTIPESSLNCYHQIQQIIKLKVKNTFTVNSIQENSGEFVQCFWVMFRCFTKPASLGQPILLRLVPWQLGQTHVRLDAGNGDMTARLLPGTWRAQGFLSSQSQKQGTWCPFFGDFCHGCWGETKRFWNPTLGLNMENEFTACRDLSTLSGRFCVFSGGEPSNRRIMPPCGFLSRHSLDLIVLRPKTSPSPWNISQRVMKNLPTNSRASVD